jgi:predicted nucleotidyltransferase
MVDQHPELIKLGYFGSYARGDWGVGSDLDLIAIVNSSEMQFSRRPLAWDLLKLPVPAEIVIYTLAEWQKLQAEGRRLAQVVANEAVWVYEAMDEEK